MGFTRNEDEEDPRPRCVICYEFVLDACKREHASKQIALPC